VGVELAAPIPARPITVRAVRALSVTLTLPLRDPVCCGLKLTLMAHEPAGAMGDDETQLSVLIFH
jgi:hypothetical protein